MADNETNSLYQFGNPGQPMYVLERLKRLETGDPRLRRGGFGPQVGNFSRVSTNVLDSSATINLVSPGLVKQGSVAPTMNTSGFAYTATTTSITWYWDGTNGSDNIVIRRSDLTITVIPPGNITISGLSANTTYWFLPFWSPVNTCTIGWVMGTVGVPQIAFISADITSNSVAPPAVIQQTYQNREPLSASWMSAVTPAAGSGGGSAGGGGSSGSCVMTGTDIETMGDIPYDIRIHPQRDWERIQMEDGRSLTCTPNHQLFHAEKGKVRADSLSIGEKILMNNGERIIKLISFFMKLCTKHEVRMKEGHIYYGNGFMSHNVKPHS